MSTSKSDRPLNDKPTPDDLAGIPFCVEEEEKPALRVRGTRDGKVPEEKTHAATPPANAQTLPTPDDLAGIPVLVEEDRLI